MISSSGDIHGTFADPDKPKSGLTIHQFGEIFVIHCVTYKQGKQDWYVITGKADSLTITEVVDGVWGSANPVEEKRVGTAKLKSDVFFYRFDDGRIGELDLEVIF